MAEFLHHFARATFSLPWDLEHAHTRSTRDLNIPSSQRARHCAHQPETKERREKVGHWNRPEPGFEPWTSQPPANSSLLAPILLWFRQFFFARGNSSWLAPIFLCSRQFFFARANSSLLTPILLCSRQFFFAHSSFLTPILLCSRQFFFAHASSSFLYVMSVHTLVIQDRFFYIEIMFDNHKIINSLTIITIYIHTKMHMHEHT